MAPPENLVLLLCSEELNTKGCLAVVDAEACSHALTMFASATGSPFLV
jgi:hypothetical protein